jgi:peptidoglycan/LPS O-acetylase OafA/YrhL
MDGGDKDGTPRHSAAVAAMTGEKKKERLGELDVLRGLAAFMVLTYHFLYRYQEVFAVDAVAQPIPGIPVKYLGLIPVYAFFMISGFVIFWTIERSATAADFAFSRFSRLYPPYWIAVILTGLVAMTYPFPESFAVVTLSFWLVNLTMLQEYFRVPNIDGVYWSLNVEMTFYLWVFVAKKFAWLPHARRALLVWALLTVGYGFFNPEVNPIPWPIVTFLLLAHGQFFIVGIVSYGIWKSGRATREDGLLLALAMAAIWLRYPPVVSAVLTAFSGIFLALAFRRMGWIVNPVLMWLGAISYSLYLIHQNIGFLAMELLDLSPLNEFVIATALSLGAASALTFAVERPVLRSMRRWWTAYRTKALVSAQGAKIVAIREQQLHTQRSQK